MEIILAVAITILSIGFVLMTILYFRERSRAARYKDIRDIDEETKLLEKRALEKTVEIEGQEERIKALSQEIQDLGRKIGEGQEAVDFQERSATLQSEVSEHKAKIAELRKELLSVEDALEIQSFGFYQPRYGFDSSSEYGVRLKEVREDQKALIREKRAAHCPTEWTVDGSRAKGRQMINQKMKLMLRAFNGECDAAISKVKYNNALNMERRIQKSLEMINRLGKSNNVWITSDYLNQKLSELYLVHEYHEKLQEEKEEQRRIKEQMREELKAQKEIDRALADAEKEEARNQKALEKARRELAESTGRQHEKLEALVIRLENELREALDRKAKAIARAQLTKSGHVYIVSNLGSFGDGVYKIGLTRRLEPLERINELGGPSVPFRYDVHAMIYSEDAPTLESKLHKLFDDRRLNKVNLRREFFKVTLDEIRHAVAKLHGIVTFVTVPEAEEYRKTMAIEAERQKDAEAV